MPQAIYGQICLGNGYQFDAYNQDVYTPIKTTDTGVTAITDVIYSAAFLGDQLGYNKINKGILSYNKNLLAYIAAEFDDASVSEE